MNKLFFIGLPRTGTTSVSVALLDHFKVAHTAYTKHAFALADVISDCPCFCDYKQLDVLFPDSKFVYLQRPLPEWIPSIRMLLNKIEPLLNSEKYVNPILKRCFNEVFALNVSAQPFSEDYLTTCYQRHEQAAFDYFGGRDDFLSIDVADSNSCERLFEFLEISFSEKQQFPHLNIGKRVDNWKEVKHHNKVNPHAAGTEGRKFFNYSGVR